MGLVGMGAGLGIAASGLLLVLFLLAHLAGLGLALWDGPAFERYAIALHQAPWLPVAEMGLLALLLTHPMQALARALANRAARGAVAGSLRSRRDGGMEPFASLAGRLMPWSGGLLLVFLVVHLAQLRLHRPAAGEELAALGAVLHQPHWLGLYAVAGLAVTLHLAHGQESAHRRLGLLDPRNARPIRLGGRALALLIGAGFSLLPFALLQRGLP
jgi:succinate dehydrogenase / fumarate reductase cytochrome b subunit